VGRKVAKSGGGLGGWRGGGWAINKRNMGLLTADEGVRSPAEPSKTGTLWDQKRRRKGRSREMSNIESRQNN